MTTDAERRADELERDISQTRAELSGTIDAIQSRLTPGQLMDQAISYARSSLPAEFGSNLAESVRNNPIPIALIGIGVAWAALAGRRGSMGTRSYGASGYDDEFGSMTERAGATADHARATLAGARDRVADTLASTRDKVSGTMASTRDKVSGTMAATRDRVTGTMASARESMSHLSERSMHGYQQARNSIGSLIEEQPLVLGALGVAVGAALGAALPRTQQEDQLLGSTRDDLLRRAADTTRDYADRAAERARTGVGAMADRAHRALDEAHATAGGGMERDTGAGERSAGRSSTMTERPAASSEEVRAGETRR